jgi:hypothetical protein
MKLKVFLFSRISGLYLARLTMVCQSHKQKLILNHAWIVLFKPRNHILLMNYNKQQAAQSNKILDLDLTQDTINLHLLHSKQQNLMFKVKMVYLTSLQLDQDFFKQFQTLLTLKSRFN